MTGVSYHFHILYFHLLIHYTIILTSSTFRSTFLTYSFHSPFHILYFTSYPDWVWSGPTDSKT